MVEYKGYYVTTCYDICSYFCQIYKDRECNEEIDYFVVDDTTEWEEVEKEIKQYIDINWV